LSEPEKKFMVLAEGSAEGNNRDTEDHGRTQESGLHRDPEEGISGLQK